MKRNMNKREIGKDKKREKEQMPRKKDTNGRLQKV